MEKPYFFYLFSGARMEKTTGKREGGSILRENSLIFAAEKFA